MPKSVVPKHLLETSRRLRREATPAEDILWAQLRDRKLGGVKFGRQEPISGYIADFYAASSKLIIELDGAVHNDPEIHFRDQQRQVYLESFGYRVLRFTNSEIEKSLASVLRDIRDHLRR